MPIFPTTGAFSHSFTRASKYILGTNSPYNTFKKRKEKEKSTYYRTPVQTFFFLSFLFPVNVFFYFFLFCRHGGPFIPGILENYPPADQQGPAWVTCPLDDLVPKPTQPPLRGGEEKPASSALGAYSTPYGTGTCFQYYLSSPCFPS